MSHEDSKNGSLRVNATFVVHYICTIVKRKINITNKIKFTCEIFTAFPLKISSGNLEIQRLINELKSKNMRK